MFRWGIDSITFSGGQEIRLGSGAVLILIGPNNSGKSRALRDIEAFFASPDAPRVVVSAVAAVRDGTLESFSEWLRKHYPSRLTRDGVQYFYTRAASLAANRVERAWQRGDTLQEAHAFLIHRLDTTNRLTIADRVGAIDPYRDQPAAYIHLLQANDDLRSKASQEVRSAFDLDLIINWGAGSQVGFHVGEEPERGPGPDHDRVSEPYLSDLNQLPRLEEEGDGIRSFAGGLLAALCGAHPIVLIDEPEAFLHPPQARRLSAALARTAESLERQVIIVTHSADVVRGALEASQRVSVCRITRETTGEADVNNASLLDSEQLAELWSKPLLRSSAAFDGLFHEGVVVCEADADCRFYEAILRRMEVQECIDRAADLHFVHGGGKGQLATLARAYRSLDTRTAVVADLDLFRNESEIAHVISALGGDFSQTQSLFNTVHSSLSSRPPVTSFGDLLGKARGILDDSEKRGALTTESRSALEGLLQGAADWSEAKRYGMTKLRGGDRKAAERLLDEWAGIGLFLVPVGELECWWPEGPAAKNEWFPPAIKEILEDEGSMREAAAFMARVCGWFGYQIASK